MAPAPSSATSTVSSSSSWSDHINAIWPVVLATIFEFLAIVAVALRFYSHHIKTQVVALHDYFILVALFFSTILVAFLISAVAVGGLGQHTAELLNPTVQLVTFAKIYVANSPIWACAISSVKISILLLYIQVFQTPSFRKWCYVLIGIQTLWCVACILESLLLCRPLAINWDPTIPGHCGSTTAAYLAAHCTNLLLDISVAIAPIPVLWQLQMKRGKKIGISVMFALGLIICIITIARIVLFRDLVTTDLTYTTVILFFFTILEPLLGIVLACLPLVRPATQQLATYSSHHRHGLLKSTENHAKGQYADSSGGSSRKSDKRDFDSPHRQTESTSMINVTGGSENCNLDDMHSKNSQAHIARPQNLDIRVTNTWDVQSR